MTAIGTSCNASGRRVAVEIMTSSPNDVPSSCAKAVEADIKAVVDSSARPALASLFIELSPSDVWASGFPDNSETIDCDYLAQRKG